MYIVSAPFIGASTVCVSVSIFLTCFVDTGYRCICRGIVRVLTGRVQDFFKVGIFFLLKEMYTICTFLNFFISFSMVFMDFMEILFSGQVFNTRYLKLTVGPILTTALHLYASHKSSESKLSLFPNLIL